ncbi:MAG: hypothetical protein ACYTF0_09290, partial [Planctomycetota bacterium]
MPIRTLVRARGWALFALLFCASLTAAEPLPTILAIGQSNTVGRPVRGKTVPAEMAAIRNLHSYIHTIEMKTGSTKGITTVDASGSWQAVDWSDGNQHQVGPEIGLLSGLNLKEAGLIKVAVGGTSLQAHWKPDERDGFTLLNATIAIVE